ncbi:MAG: diaminopimelate decarboxylase [Myxococcota bacterium]
MDFFERRDGVLHADGADLRDIARAVGTPTYVYSAATLARHVRVMSEALDPLPHLLCYAVKANGNLALLELLHEAGCGFDAVSIGELARVWRAGGSMANTILSGVGKREDEIEGALRAGCRYVCIESAPELDTVISVAKRLGVQAPVTVRVNPDVDAQTHPYISTGLRENKFGVPSEEASALYDRGNANEHIAMVGLSCHIGSQITTLDPFLDAAKRVAELAVSLRNAGAPLEHVGMGGGLGIPYGDEAPPPPARYGEALKSLLGGLGLTLVLEPGRVIVGNAGILLTRAIRLKRHGEHHFAIVDAGMNDLLRPALYQAHHAIVPVEGEDASSERYDVVGPVCESADTFGKQTVLPELAEGDLLALRSAGAYSFVMASNYNGRPRPAEVLCRDGEWHVVRARETLNDLYRGERHLDGRPADLTTIPGFLSQERDS